jgi:hypothetical protein
MDDGGKVIFIKNGNEGTGNFAVHTASVVTQANLCSPDGCFLYAFHVS